MDRYRKQTNTVAGRTCDNCPNTIAVGEDYYRALTPEGGVKIYDAACVTAVAGRPVLLPGEGQEPDPEGTPDAVHGAHRKERGND